MTSTALTPPSPIPAIGADDVARVDLWAARQRAELSRLALAVRSAQVRAERAERAVPLVEAPPEELFAALDSMLDAAVRAADLAIEAAREDAALDAAAEIPELARPVSVAELWQDLLVVDPTPELAEVIPLVEDVELAEVISLSDDPEVVPTVVGTAQWAHPSRHVVPAMLGPPPPSAPDPSEVPVSIGPMPRTSDDGELFDVFWRGPEAFDVFWGEAEEHPRPLRDRLRRRVAEGQP